MEEYEEGPEEEIYPEELGDIEAEELEDVEAFREAAEEETTSYVAGYEELSALRYRPGGLEIIEGISKGLQKTMRTPEEATLEQAQGILSDSKFDNLEDARKERVMS